MYYSEEKNIFMSILSLWIGALEYHSLFILDSPRLSSLEVDVCDMVDSGETIVTEIVLFQPGLDNFRYLCASFSIKTDNWKII
jgi:hypothetical protein